MEVKMYHGADSMNKEFKVVIWAGVLVFILLLNVFRNLPREDASQILNVLIWGYCIFAILSIIEGIYKWVRRLAPKKQDTLKP
jgi:phosphatidylglycerophosphate synthase